MSVSSFVKLAGLVLIVATSAHAEAPVSFRAAGNLFDREDLKTLGLQPVGGQHTMLYRAPEDGYRFCHHPNLIVFQDRMYCMWSNGLVNEDDAGQRILYCHTDNGETWSTPVQLATHQDGRGICVAAGFHVAGETLVAYYTTTGGSNFHPETCLRARTSEDGNTWSEPQRLASGFYIEGPQQLKDGRLLMAGEHVGDERQSKRMKFLLTDDPNGLDGWREAVLPNLSLENLKNFGYTEPSFFIRPDGAVVSTLRNYSGFLYSIVSHDNGASWTGLGQTNYLDSTARTSAGNLPNGSAFIINNAMPKKFDRSLLTIGLSKGGSVFDQAWIVRSETTAMRHQGRSKLNGWQYPHAVAWKGGLYVAYSINKEDVAVTKIPLHELR